METKQTCTRTYICVMSMFGARFAVFVRRARVLPSPSQATRNLSFTSVSPAPSRCCFNSLFHWTGTGRFEIPTKLIPCKHVRACGGGTWEYLAHGLQCLCVRGACCPSLAKQLVILSFLRVSTGIVICCFNSMCTGMYPVGMNVPLKTNRANKYAHVPLCRERVWRTV